MCGIIGYIGNRPAQDVLIRALSRLEYRGYDSCGIAVQNGKVDVYKDAVRVKDLEGFLPSLEGSLGIGHTRWATHGQPSQLNSHPHLDCSGCIAVVHNGVINNFRSLRQQLVSEGHRFISETDTEVIPHLIEKYYRGDLAEAVSATVQELNGCYAIAVIKEGESKLITAKKDCPLVIGIGDGEYFAASDVPAILDYTDRVIYLEDGDIGTISRDAIRITNNNKPIERVEQKILWSVEDVKKNGYDHFMIKEIHEQPKVIFNSLGLPLIPGGLDFRSNVDPNINFMDLAIIACGTSYHAGLVCKYIIEELTGVPVRVELASEFNHCRRTIPTAATVVITQSGETADVLMAMKRVKDVSGHTIVVTNVPGSTASRIADQSIFTNAGPEISVAATKTFMAQLMVLYQLALYHPNVNSKIKDHLCKELTQLPNKVQWIIDNYQQILECSTYLSHYENAFFISRGINYPIAMEGALKLKEISYIHADGFAAGELKHGPFALLEDRTPVIAIAAHDNTYEAMITNIKEIKSRNAPVIAVVDESDVTISEMADFVIRVPKVSNLLTPIINTVVMQLLAYHTAVQRGCPVDYPRNLAKSVTVE